jgi:hypothetical protein
MVAASTTTLCAAPRSSRGRASTTRAARAGGSSSAARRAITREHEKGQKGDSSPGPVTSGFVRFHTPGLRAVPTRQRAVCAVLVHRLMACLGAVSLMDRTTASTSFRVLSLRMSTADFVCR